MGKIIAVANQKGGVGKTTTTVNITASLKALGKRVLLCDFDPQANATSGLGVDKETKEGRILDAILDILEDVAHDIEDLEENAWELGEAIDQVSDALSDIEDIVYDLDEDEDDVDDDAWEDDEDECYYEVTCPKCGDTIELNEEMLDEGSIDCPNCGETLEFDLEEDDSCDCGENCDCNKE